MKQLCVYCGIRDREPHNVTCLNSHCQEANYQAQRIWNALGRRQKLALASRERPSEDVAPAMSRASASVRGEIMRRCDKYASETRRPR